MSEHYARLSDETTWPLPDREEGGLAWVLTYGEPTRVDMIRAAAVIGAYGYLLTETNAKRRARVVRDIRAALLAPAPPAEAAASDGSVGS